ncbi:hypothetical protein Dimus_007149 [Dionaea muscipula]
MTSAFRNAYCLLLRSFPINPNPNPKSLPSLPHFFCKAPAIVISLSSALCSGSFGVRSLTTPPCCSPLMADGASHRQPGGNEVEKQFHNFHSQLEEAGSLRERIRVVAMEIESVARVMHANLLLVHQLRPLSEVLEKTKAQIGVLKELFKRLAAILQEYPGQYYRYHNDWRTETQTVVSLLAFMQWLETGNLLMHTEAEEKLGLDGSDFGLDIEDYLVGICFMSNELPRYVVNQVTSGDYDCPRKVLNFLTDLHASFRMLNLRNDFLRKKFDGMKYDLRKVEEVYYDVKIRGLMTDVKIQA